MLRDVVSIACDIRRSFDDDILPMPEIDIHGQDISERDNPNLSIAFSRAVTCAAELYDRRMINTKEMLRLSYQFGGFSLTRPKTNPKECAAHCPTRSNPLPPTPPTLPQ